MQRRGAVSNEGEVEALLQLRTVQIPGELNGAAGIYQIKTPHPLLHIHCVVGNIYYMDFGVLCCAQGTG